MDEDQARSEAEARRQRILDSANKRMDQVNGLSGGDGKEAEEDAAGNKKMSKLAAMRRRRFKKNAGGDTAAAATPETPTSTEATPASQTETKESTPPPTPVQKEPVAEQTEPAAQAKSPETGGSEGTKKYMGVAKMRRKMIKEQQKQKEDPAAAAADDDQGVSTTVPKKFAKGLSSSSAPKPLWPILMHLLTIFCLFATGFEVGLQQSVIEYRGDGLTIHETMAPRQELRLLNQGVSFSSSSPTPQIVKEAVNVDIDVDEVTAPYLTEDDEDEFGSGEKETTNNEENLDPLFGVDLDALTAGPGLVNFMGRLAIRGHRMILAIFYYFPIAIWVNILALISSPPVLCLTTLAIRQGSHLLGGKLPELIPEDGKSSAQKQDIMSTIKSFVSNLILKSFPTAFKLYDAWTHLRSDMYVVMCGLFVGLVWHHYLSSSAAAVPSSNTKTLVSDEL